MKDTLNEKTGLAIRHARERANLTQEQLAERLDCSPQYISLLENGHYSISTKMLRTLCATLNVSSDSILFPEESDRSLQVMSYRCRDLSDEQYRLLLEIIGRVLDALHL